MANENLIDPVDAGATDIIFDCPHCGKSLAIDERGAGLVITCPDCNQQVQVPVPDEEQEVDDVVVKPEADPQEQIKSLSEALTKYQTKVERLVASLEEVRARRTYLEKLRTDNMTRFEQVSGEVSLIQASLDRLVTILQEATEENSISD